MAHEQKEHKRKHKKEASESNSDSATMTQEKSEMRESQDVMSEENL